MAKYKTKKECFTTYINHQGEIFNVVNKIHIKYKKNEAVSKLEMASVVSFQIEVIWISLKR